MLTTLFFVVLFFDALLISPVPPFMYGKGLLCFISSGSDLFVVNF